MKAIQYDLGGVTTAEEALDKSQSKWTALLVPLQTIADGDIPAGIKIPDNKAVVRSDNHGIIGLVGDRYTPLQNAFAYSWFDTVCLQNNARYTSAYVIDGGRKLILEATVGDPITIRKGDEVHRKIQLINTFDGSYPFTAIYRVWRQICKNGMMGWANENKCKVHHTKNGEIKAGEALRILAAGTTYFEKFEATCRKLAQVVCDAAMVDKFIKECFSGAEGGTRQKNLINKVTELYEAGKGTGQGTLYDLYNGYVEWIDHFRSADAETRLANSVLGASYLKEEAWKTAVALAN